MPRMLMMMMLFTKETSMILRKPSVAQENSTPISWHLNQDFEPAEFASFKYYAGYIVSRVIRNNVACQRCASLLVNTDSEPEGSLIALKEYREGCLTHPSDEVVEMLKTCEAVFQKAMPVLVHESKIAQKIIAAMTQATASVVLPDCHNIKEKTISRFCHARLHLFAQEQSKRETQNHNLGSGLDSKSMAAPRYK